jgi:alkylation response protein AidB-like acyl-CoA dehydrogenase
LRVAVLTEEQQMLKDMAADWSRENAPVTAYRSLYETADGPGFDPRLYAQMAEMGWTGIIVPEEYGGSDFGYQSLGLVLEELGRTLTASPLISSAMAAASALRLAGTQEQKARWLPGIADGSLVGTLAVDEGAHHFPEKTALAAKKSDAEWILHGVKWPVADGMAAQVAVVAARTSGHPGERDGLTLFLVDCEAPGLERKALDQIDARRPAIFTFEGVAASPDSVLGEPDRGADLLEAILDRARIALSAEMLGAATQAFEITTDYLRTRTQFGHLIGSFQALQHRAADMLGELMLARSAVEAALAAIDSDDPDLPRFASLAKALAGDTARRVTNEMIQMHGGIGMTHEHDAGLYLKRVRVAEQCYGNSAYHRERWGRLSGF